MEEFIIIMFKEIAQRPQNAPHYYKHDGFGGGGVSHDDVHDDRLKHLLALFHPSFSSTERGI